MVFYIGDALITHLIINNLSQFQINIFSKQLPSVKKNMPILAIVVTKKKKKRVLFL